MSLSQVSQAHYKRCCECKTPFERHQTPILSLLGDGEIKAHASFCSKTCQSRYTRLDHLEDLNKQILIQANVIPEHRETLLREAAAEKRVVRVDRINLACEPLSKEDMGAANWTSLHSFAAAYPQTPTQEERENMEAYLVGFSTSYPCRECRAHFLEHIKERPWNLESGESLRMWVCQVHNDVNAMLGKPIVPCVCISTQLKSKYVCLE